MTDQSAFKAHETTATAIIGDFAMRYHVTVRDFQNERVPRITLYVELGSFRLNQALSAVEAKDLGRLLVDAADQVEQTEDDA